jgi:carbonic anhydrase
VCSSDLRGSQPAPLVHGWIFSLEDGRIKVLASGYPADDAATSNPETVAPAAQP